MKIKKILVCIMALGSMLTAGGQEVILDKEFLFVGHRGASYLAPENTLASIQLAWELGADAAECDVMLTRDKQVILFHDKNTKKLCGVSHNIQETDWAVLKDLSVQPRKTNLSEYGPQPIPLLQEVMGIIPADRMLVIEIKSDIEILPFLQKVIEKYWEKGKISFIAFDLETIIATKKMYPKVPCYYLSALKPDLNNNFNAIVESGLDGVDLRYAMIDHQVMEKCKEAGLDVWCWTVNDLDTARKMKELGVSSVTTDRPAWLKENL